MNDLFSQEYVAKKLNVDRSTVSKHERGEMPPTVAQFFQYGAIYNCDVYYLMGLTEEEKPFPETIKQEYE
ncbi:MAG: helix-turn-helix transcriptional regulator [Lachnospiraceae bacterium]|nr:helix-turn-helix transcriptional regulator [Lachnospiraceae bacterium]